MEQQLNELIRIFVFIVLWKQESSAFPEGAAEPPGHGAWEARMAESRKPGEHLPSAATLLQWLLLPVRPRGWSPCGGEREALKGKQKALWATVRLLGQQGTPASEQVCSQGAGENGSAAPTQSACRSMVRCPPLGVPESAGHTFTVGWFPSHVGLCREV